jgi:hypothetical protein
VYEKRKGEINHLQSGWLGRYADQELAAVIPDTGLMHAGGALCSVHEIALEQR